MKAESNKSKSIWGYIFLGVVAIGTWMFFSGRMERDNITENMKNKIQEVEKIGESGLDYVNEAKEKVSDYKESAIESFEEGRDSLENTSNEIEGTVSSVRDRAEQGIDDISNRFSDREDEIIDSRLEIDERANQFINNDEVSLNMSSTLRRGGTYRVNKGDTLGGISKKSGVPLPKIIEKNSSVQSNPDLIIPGQVIKL